MGNLILKRSKDNPASINLDNNDLLNYTWIHNNRIYWNIHKGLNRIEKKHTPVVNCHLCLELYDNIVIKILFPVQLLDFIDLTGEREKMTNIRMEHLTQLPGHQQLLCYHYVE